MDSESASSACSVGPGTPAGTTTGSGSTEVTNAGSTDRLNVRASGQWTITIESA